MIFENSSFHPCGLLAQIPPPWRCESDKIIIKCNYLVFTFILRMRSITDSSIVKETRSTVLMENYLPAGFLIKALYNNEIIFAKRVHI